MYVWNGFTVVGKRPDLTESILSTLEKAEKQLQTDLGKILKLQRNKYNISLI